ncbi:MAG: hypothetical protein WBP85_04645, partial [Terracidiphilus sp.]
QQSKPVDPVVQTGLTETALGHTLIEHAAQIADGWLDPALNIHLVPSWKASDASAGSDPVKIYAISEFHAPANYMVAVPVGCRCIFVEPHVYQSWLKDHMSTSGVKLDVDEQRLLAFMFLHEAGHIVNHDPGDFDAGGRGALNLDPTDQKDREQKADAFAVEQLKGAMARRSKTDAWTEAQMATMDLGNLSFEMQQVRSEKYFGSALLHTPTAYYDTGYTHPNFELRILTVNDLISNTSTSHQLLENFVEGRRSDAKPWVLYQAPSLTQ